MPEIVSGFNCPKCAAPLRIESGNPIVVCEYCKTTVNIREDRIFIVAHSWIPNKLGKEAVEAAARDWMRSGMMMPSDLSSKAKFFEEELIFVPLWVFHVRAKTKYSGLLTRTGGREKRGGNFEKEYFWKLLARRVSDFPVKEYHVPLEGKIPFTLEQYPRNAKLLNGEIEEGEAETLLKTEIELHHKKLLEENADEFSELETEIDVMDSEFIHVPVWFLKYDYCNKKHNIILDGSRGEVILGDIPEPEMLPGKMILIFVAAAILFLIMLGIVILGLIL